MRGMLRKTGSPLVRRSKSSEAVDPDVSMSDDDSVASAEESADIVT